MISTDKAVNQQVLWGATETGGRKGCTWYESTSTIQSLLPFALVMFLVVAVLLFHYSNKLKLVDL